MKTIKGIHKVHLKLLKQPKPKYITKIVYKHIVWVQLLLQLEETRRDGRYKPYFNLNIHVPVAVSRLCCCVLSVCISICVFVIIVQSEEIRWMNGEESDL